MSTSLFLLLGAQHQLRADIFLKVLFAEGLKFHSTLLESDALLVGILGHLGGHVITNDGVQAGHKHQTGQSQYLFLEPNLKFGLLTSREGES